MSRPERTRGDLSPEVVNSGASTSNANTVPNAKNVPNLTDPVPNSWSCSVRTPNSPAVTSFLRKRKIDSLEDNIYENMSDHPNDRTKRANFSAISSNGLNRSINIINLKPTATKKLVIKNLKSKYIRV